LFWKQVVLNQEAKAVTSVIATRLRVVVSVGITPAIANPFWVFNNTVGIDIIEGWLSRRRGRCRLRWILAVKGSVYAAFIRTILACICTTVTSVVTTSLRVIW
jgi:hypothetical protein